MVNNALTGLKNKNAGAYFEKMILASCREYLDMGIAKIDKAHEPMKVIKSMPRGQYIACFISKSEPDFKGTLANGRSIVFEAKHTDLDRMAYNRLQENQLNALLKHQEMGAVAFVLCSFGFERFYRVPLKVWRNMKELYGHKYFTAADVEDYRIKACGVRLEFLRGDDYGAC